ncbi:CBS domain-containing protein [Extensimonas vulgaris]|uniref:CBS domain protein n=1 Tax=Extensimonas vulgaris TaxID=1031594 RepID=A0A369AIM6_9BURK|nr:CBS domain-containing protein [Extensimonas vulgaris]RCX08965.1 CBS domain protein [Extensimonas vulgaris]TWI37201.1 CBS domain protein [Extensimonas vulgaris]TXD14311.1 CBS domain-containing protein [Extensimonas vulgaris]
MADTFFVFGPMGQIYRGGAERLSEVLPVQPVQRPQAVRRAEGVPLHAPPAPKPLPAATAPPRWQEAVRAYVQTEQPAPAERRPLTQVRDVMTPHAISVHPDERANDAWQMLAERQVAQAPVVDAQGRVVGLLLRADLAPEKLLPAADDVQKAIALARRPVSEVMVSPVPTVSADTSLRRVAQVLLQTGLPGLPVTDAQGTLQGFISRTDILRAVAADPPLDLWVGPTPA